MVTHPVFLPVKSYGQRRLVGYSLWGHKELDMLECTRTHTYSQLAELSEINFVGHKPPSLWYFSYSHLNRLNTF